MRKIKRKVIEVSLVKNDTHLKTVKKLVKIEID